jgi:hypothetical protein
MMKQIQTQESLCKCADRKNIYGVCELNCCQRYMTTGTFNGKASICSYQRKSKKVKGI